MTNVGTKASANLAEQGANSVPNKRKPKNNTAIRSSNASKRAARAAKKKTGAAKKPAQQVSARNGSKKVSVLALLERKDGATLAELMEATGWQPHSVRGFLSSLGKKMGLAIESGRQEGGGRVYRLV